jgi:hypothetical protein
MHKNLLIWVLGIAAVLLLVGRIVIAPSIFAARGSLRALPPATDVVPNGTHFLILLDDDLSTAKSKLNKKFDARTIEPLQTSNGYILPPGAKVRGHVSRIDPGGLIGGARLWLTFDDIDTTRGRLPLVAEVSSVPGNFSVRPGESREGEIEARTTSGKRELEAVAAGAVIGAAPGAAAHNGKDAAAGAAAGSVAAFLASSGLGHDLELPKGTKIDLVLDRPLYLGR